MVGIGKGYANICSFLESYDFLFEFESVMGGEAKLWRNDYSEDKGKKSGGDIYLFI